MDDLISRQEAIDAVTEHAKWLWETWRKTCSLAGITEVISNLPPAQPETHEKRTETHARDLIDRQAAIDAYGDWYVEEGTEEGFIGTVKQLLEGLPSAQSEIIRCRECKHYQFADNRAFGMPVKMCEWFGFEDVDDDDFCSRAERRQDE